MQTNLDWPRGLPEARPIFAHHLKSAMDKQGLSRSEFCALVWGYEDEENQRRPKLTGYLSQLLNAKTLPGKDKTEPIATALGFNTPYEMLDGLPDLDQFIAGTGTVVRKKRKPAQKKKAKDKPYWPKGTDAKAKEVYAENLRRVCTEQGIENGYQLSKVLGGNKNNRKYSNAGLWLQGIRIPTLKANKIITRTLHIGEYDLLTGYAPAMEGTAANGPGRKTNGKGKVTSTPAEQAITGSYPNIQINLRPDGLVNISFPDAVPVEVANALLMLFEKDG